ncbi:hypothetical protein NMG60_11013737 [Bertholletia excelsa]
MDHMTLDEGDLLIDLESGRITNEDGTNQGPDSGNRQESTFFTSFVSGLWGFNRSVEGECGVNSDSDLGKPSEVAAEGGESLQLEHVPHVGNNPMKEKWKKPNHKKAPKPPRPPKGPSLDAADLKLVKELSALTMKKRARKERMKALRKLKETKSSLSSNSSLTAMVITLLFLIVLIFQGFWSAGNSSISPESPRLAPAANSLISVQFYGNPSANDGNGLDSESPSSAEKDSVSKFRSAGYVEQLL